MKKILLIFCIISTIVFSETEEKNLMVEDMIENVFNGEGQDEFNKEIDYKEVYKKFRYKKNKTPEEYLILIEATKEIVKEEEDIRKYRKIIAEIDKYYEIYNKSIKFSDPEMIYEWGNFNIKSGYYEKAYDAFSKDKSGDYKNVLGVAVSARFIGKYATAIKKYQQFLKIKPEVYEVYLGLGTCYQLMGNYPSAIKWFNMYLARKADNNVYLAIASMYMAEEQYAKARSVLVRGQGAVPHSREIRELLAEVNLKLGR